MNSEKKLLILKVGNALPSLIPERGDYEMWILTGMELKRDDVVVVDVRNGFFQLDLSKICGIVITGSDAMVTDGEEWSEKIANWLPAVVEKNIPLLGICYGHQLLAYAFGGEVEDNPNGREYGAIEIEMNGYAADDLLFCNLPRKIRSYASHTQSVLKLPGNATLLGSNGMDKNQAFAIGRYAWGVQFHPEFDAQIEKEYIRNSRNELIAEGQNPDKLIASYAESPHGKMLLKRFANIIKQSD